MGRGVLLGVPLPGPSGADLLHRSAVSEGLASTFLLNGADGSLTLPTTARPSLLSHTSSPLPSAAAVRTGNLAKFNQVLDQFGDKFQADGNYTLIIRLRHNVIKTGRRCGWGPCHHQSLGGRLPPCAAWWEAPFLFPLPPQVSA